MAGTVIDSLVVTLGLDDAAYKSGSDRAMGANKKLRDDAAKTAKEVSAPNKAIAESFNRIKVEALGVAAVLAGGIGLKDLLSNSINVSASTGRMAYNIGMATRELSAWGNMVRQVGGDPNATAGSIFGLSQAIEGQRLGIQSPAVALLTRTMGIKATNPDGSTRDMSDILLDVSAYMHKHSAQFDNIIGSQLGLDQGTTNLLETQTPAQLRAGLLSQSSVDDAEAKAAEALQKEFAVLQTKFQSVENTMMKELTPALLSMGNAIEKVDWAAFASSAGQMADSLKQIPWGSFATDINWLLSSADMLNNAQKSIDDAGSDVHKWFMNLWKATNGTQPFDTFMTGLLGPTDNNSAVLKQGMQFFQAQGASPQVAAAIMAQAQAESNFDPTALSPPDANGERAHGLFQLRGDREAQFESMFGMPAEKAPAAMQYAFAWWELQNTHQAAFAAMTNATSQGAATTAATDLFEVPFGPNVSPSQRAFIEQQRIAMGQQIASGNYTNNVGDIHIHMPPGTKADPKTLTSAVRQRLMHEGLIAPANSGLQ
jgi:hypothetical protein